MPKMLINGVLRDRPLASDGRFHRLQSPFTSHISVQPGAPFPNTPGRYHLYLSKACPWCHGVDLILTLKGLRNAFSITWMDPVMSENGWVIDQTLFDDQSGVKRTRFLYEVCQSAKPDYTGPISVPVLLDKVTGRIVSTESAEIMGLPSVANTVDMAHIRQHYFRSHRHINPSGIIPIGPASLRTADVPEMGAA